MIAASLIVRIEEALRLAWRVRDVVLQKEDVSSTIVQLEEHLHALELLRDRLRDLFE